MDRQIYVKKTLKRLRSPTLGGHSTRNNFPEKPGFGRAFDKEYTFLIKMYGCCIVV